MSRPEPWRPEWAHATAQALLALAAAAAVYLAWVIAGDLAETSDKFHGLAAGLAGVGLGLLAFAAAPWVWFVVRGGKVAFAAGSAFLVVLFGVWMLAGF